MEFGQFYRVYVGDPEDITCDFFIEKEILDKLGLCPNQHIELDETIEVMRCKMREIL